MVALWGVGMQLKFLLDVWSLGERGCFTKRTLPYKGSGCRSVVSRSEGTVTYVVPNKAPQWFFMVGRSSLTGIRRKVASATSRGHRLGGVDRRGPFARDFFFTCTNSTQLFVAAWY